MGLIGHEIVQSRTYIDPTNPAPPNLNYTYTFPITVFDAVRRSMSDEDSETLTEVLDKIYQELKSRQMLIPNKPANYLMTYAGTEGGVGSIKISTEIPWDESEQSNNRIPTEKAVGDLIRKLGIDPNNPDSGVTIRWSDIIGRPSIYSSLGNDDNGIIGQKALTEIINNITSRIDTNDEIHTNQITMMTSRVENHVNDQNNPHHITLSQLGAVSSELFNIHINSENPHNINTTMLGLNNVDNTRDMDKPISSATQAALDRLNQLFTNMTDDIGDLNFVTNVTYNSETGEFNILYRNGAIVILDSPLENSVIDVRYEIDTKSIIMTHLSGNETTINLSDLFIRYIGSTSTNISVEIDGTQTTGDQIIRATIIPKSIRSNDLADDSVVSRVIKEGAITGPKIHDLTITTIKLADDSVTGQKIDRWTIENRNINSRVVDGRILFAADEDYRILATLKANENPVWTLVSANMIGYDAIETRHINKSAVTYDKLADDSVGTAKISDFSITTEKLKDRIVTTEKIKKRSITSELLAEDLIFEGRARLATSPNDSADNDLVVDTRWVRKFAKESLVVENHNIAPNAVTGDKLFSSSTPNRILGVTTAGTNPEWTTVNNNMMGDDSVSTRNIIDKSVNASKIADLAIESRQLNKSIVQTKHIVDGAVTSEKLYTSNEANRVLAALSENGHPTYSQVTNAMVAPNAIDTLQLKDDSVSLSKIKSSSVGQQVMTVGLKDSTPVWSKVMTQMINDRAVDGSKLFTSDRDNVILGLSRAGFNPTWTKVSGDMIAERTIKSINIGEKAIDSAVIGDGAIIDRHISEDAIIQKHIKDGIISPSKLESADHSNRVMGVVGLPYSTPMWVQVNTDMIEDEAITKDKLFKSNYPYHVLAATQAGVPPEYTMVSHHFIVDGTIIPQKLQKDFTLLGTPELTVPPAADSNDYKLANTSWVRELVDRRVVEYITGKDIEGWPPKFDFNDIPDHGIDGSKLFTTASGPRVLGVTAPNADVEFILIEENLIADGSISTNKIQRSIHLLGSPQVEIRPSPSASDGDGDGHLIPDCQWVLDRIYDAINGSGVSGGTGSGTGSSTATLSKNSVTTNHIQNRAVTGDKLFTSAVKNRLLGVVGANTSPVYLQAINEMIGDRAVDGRTLFTSDTAERILGVHNSGSNPVWTQITSQMIGTDVIENHHLKDEIIQEHNIESGSISTRTLRSEPVVANIHIYDDAVTKNKIRDNAVTESKIIDDAISTSKIKDSAVTSEKLADDIELPTDTVVKSSRNYEQKSVRNITISPNNPRGGRNGDIWFRFS